MADVQAIRRSWQMHGAVPIGASAALFSTDTNAAAVMQAVLEGVAFSIADVQDPLDKAETDIARAAMAGGGAQSKLWTTTLAKVLNVPLTRYDGADGGPAFVAARLARMALSGEAAEIVVVVPEVRDVTGADPALAAAYSPALERFRNLYQAVRDPFGPAAWHRTHRPSLGRH